MESQISLRFAIPPYNFRRYHIIVQTIDLSHVSIGTLPGDLGHHRHRLCSVRPSCRRWHSGGTVLGGGPPRHAHAGGHSQPYPTRYVCIRATDLATWAIVIKNFFKKKLEIYHFLSIIFSFANHSKDSRHSYIYALTSINIYALTSIKIHAYTYIFISINTFEKPKLISWKISRLINVVITSVKSTITKRITD